MDNPFLMSSRDLFRFDGIDIISEQPRPKMKLKPGLCSPEFEAEMNLWLLDFFGLAEPVVPRGTVYISQMYGFAVMNRQDVAKISNLIY